MNSDSALLYASKGLRRSLGEFPSPAIMEVSLGFLRAIADELATIAQLEAQTDDPDEAVTGDELIQRAAKRRVADLFQDQASRDVCTHNDQCEPGCPHVAMMLLLPDRRVIQFARAWKTGRANAVALVRDAQRIVEMGRRNNLLFDDGLPPPDEPNDD